MKVLIPAAGLGTRLYPITKYIPKPLLPLDCKRVTVLSNICENITNSGYVRFKDIVIGVKSDHKKYFNTVLSKIHVYDKDHKHSGFNDLIELYKIYGKEDVFILSADNLISKQDLSNFVIKCTQHSNCVPHKIFDFARIAYFKDNDENHILNAGQLYLKQNLKYGEKFVYKLYEKPGKILSKKVACSLYYIPSNFYYFIMSYLNSPNYESDSYSEFGDIINVVLKYNLRVATYKIRDHWIDIGTYDRWMKAIEIFNKEV